jgi:hypothetical protein
MKQQTWTLKRVEQLIVDQTEEGQVLEYKAAAAIGTSDKEKNEITKDVTAFAHAAGGTLIYGISEDSKDKHLPGSLDAITEKKFTKEWLEDVISSRTDPPMRDFKITPIRAAGGVIYVIEILPSTTAHQAGDLRYYRRMNFKVEPMRGYEIRDIQNRKSAPKIEIKLSTRLAVLKNRSQHYMDLHAINEGGILSKYLKVYVLVPPHFVDLKSLYHYESTTVDGETYYRLSYDNMRQEVIGQKDTLGMPQFGPLQYHPILPGMEVDIGNFPILDLSSLESKEEKIIVKIHTDNEQPREVKYELRGGDFQPISE